MSDKQLILLAAGIAGFSLYLNSIFEIKNMKQRSILLMTHSDDIFLDSEKIKEYREKLNPNLILQQIAIKRKSLKQTKFAIKF